MFDVDRTTLAPATRAAAAARSAGPRPRRRGFTLLELLVAMTIAAVIAGSLYAALRIGFRAESRAEAAVEPTRTLELAMGLLRPDFESAVPPTGAVVTSSPGTGTGGTGTGTGTGATAIDGTTVDGLRGAFVGVDGTGDGGLPADTLEFYTLGDPLESPPFGQVPGAAGAGSGMGTGGGFVPGSGFTAGTGTAAGVDPARAADSFMPGVSDVRMVDLLLVPSNSGPVLIRRVTTNLLATTTPVPYDEVICRGVRSFNLRYFDGSTWLESWDSTQFDNMAPTAVEVTLELQRPDGDQVRVTRCTRIFLLSCSGLWDPSAATTATGGTTQ